MAASDGETTTPPPANPVWTETEGSITIHKYEWNGKTGGHATGREDEDQLPSENDGENTKTPNPLAGAEFTIYQVQNEAWLSKYYSGAATAAEEEQYKNAFKATTYYADNNGTYTLNGNYPTYGPKKLMQTVQFSLVKQQSRVQTVMIRRKLAFLSACTW